MPPRRAPRALLKRRPRPPQAGATIEQIQRSSGARIQLSRAGEFYPGGCALQRGAPRPKGAVAARLQLSGAARRRRKPRHAAGTSDRVILLSGSLHAVLTAVFLMLEKFPIDNGRGGKPKEDAVSAARHTGSDGAACRANCWRAAAALTTPLRARAQPLPPA